MSVRKSVQPGQSANKPSQSKSAKAICRLASPFLSSHLNTINSVRQKNYFLDTSLFWIPFTDVWVPTPPGEQICRKPSKPDWQKNSLACLSASQSYLSASKVNSVCKQQSSPPVCQQASQAWQWASQQASPTCLKASPICLQASKACQQGSPVCQQASSVCQQTSPICLKASQTCQQAFCLSACKSHLSLAIQFNPTVSMPVSKLVQSDNRLAQTVSKLVQLFFPRASQTCFFRASLSDSRPA